MAKKTEIILDGEKLYSDVIKKGDFSYIVHNNKKYPVIGKKVIMDETEFKEFDGSFFVKEGGKFRVYLKKGDNYVKDKGSFKSFEECENYIKGLKAENADSKGGNDTMVGGVTSTVGKEETIRNAAASSVESKTEKKVGRFRELYNKYIVQTKFERKGYTIVEREETFKEYTVSKEGKVEEKVYTKKYYGLSKDGVEVVPCVFESKKFVATYEYEAMFQGESKPKTLIATYKLNVSMKGELSYEVAYAEKDNKEGTEKYIFKGEEKAVELKEGKGDTTETKSYEPPFKLVNKALQDVHDIRIKSIHKLEEKQKTALDENQKLNSAEEGSNAKSNGIVEQYKREAATIRTNCNNNIQNFVSQLKAGIKQFFGAKVSKKKQELDNERKKKEAEAEAIKQKEKEAKAKADAEAEANKRKKNIEKNSNDIINERL